MKEKKTKKRRLPRIMTGAADGSKTYPLLPFQVRAAANPIYFPKRSQVIKNKQRRKRQGK